MVLAVNTASRAGFSLIIYMYSMLIILC